ncbi:unnamed protein product [Amoebophrya sp. A120]|nr:unnamed protein product [Amoebophrya sp. A120]|eukprot:GSA120T00019472001.1
MNRDELRDAVGVPSSVRTDLIAVSTGTTTPGGGRNRNNSDFDSIAISIDHPDPPHHSGLSEDRQGEQFADRAAGTTFGQQGSSTVSTSDVHKTSSKSSSRVSSTKATNSSASNTSAAAHDAGGGHQQPATSGGSDFYMQSQQQHKKAPRGLRPHQQFQAEPESSRSYGGGTMGNYEYHESQDYNDGENFYTSSTPMNDSTQYQNSIKQRLVEKEDEEENFCSEKLCNRKAASNMVQQFTTQVLTNNTASGTCTSSNSVMRPWTLSFYDQNLEAKFFEYYWEQQKFWLLCLLPLVTAYIVLWLALAVGGDTTSLEKLDMRYEYARARGLKSSDFIGWHVCWVLFFGTLLGIDASLMRSNEVNKDDNSGSRNRQASALKKRRTTNDKNSNDHRTTKPPGTTCSGDVDTASTFSSHSSYTRWIFVRQYVAVGIMLLDLLVGAFVNPLVTPFVLLLYVVLLRIPLPQAVTLVFTAAIVILVTSDASFTVFWGLVAICLTSSRQIEIASRLALYRLSRIKGEIHSILPAEVASFEPISGTDEDQNMLSRGTPLKPGVNNHHKKLVHKSTTSASSYWSSASVNGWPAPAREPGSFVHRSRSGTSAAGGNSTKSQNASQHLQRERAGQAAQGHQQYQTDNFQKFVVPDESRSSSRTTTTLQEHIDSHTSSLHKYGGKSLCSKPPQETSSPYHTGVMNGSSSSTATSAHASSKHTSGAATSRATSKDNSHSHSLDPDDAQLRNFERGQQTTDDTPDKIVNCDRWTDASFYSPHALSDRVSRCSFNGNNISSNNSTNGGGAGNNVVKLLNKTTTTVVSTSSSPQEGGATCSPNASRSTTGRDHRMMNQGCKNNSATSTSQSRSSPGGQKILNLEEILQDASPFLVEQVEHEVPRAKICEREPFMPVMRLNMQIWRAWRMLAFENESGASTGTNVAGDRVIKSAWMSRAKQFLDLNAQISPSSMQIHSLIAELFRTTFHLGRQVAIPMSTMKNKGGTTSNKTKNNNSSSNSDALTDIVISSVEHPCNKIWRSMLVYIRLPYPARFIQKVLADPVLYPKIDRSCIGSQVLEEHYSESNGPVLVKTGVYAGFSLVSSRIFVCATRPFEIDDGTFAVLSKSVEPASSDPVKQHVLGNLSSSCWFATPVATSADAEPLTDVLLVSHLNPRGSVGKSSLAGRVVCRASYPVMDQMARDLRKVCAEEWEKATGGGEQL